MATYTKETALYDTGAIAHDISDAAGQVNKYITAVGDDGIKVHPYNSTTGTADQSNYTRIDGEGMEIFKDSVSVSKFGELTRIGTEDDASITISDTSIVGVGENRKEFFNFTNSDAAVDTSYVDVERKSRTVSTFPTTQASAVKFVIGATDTILSIVLNVSYGFTSRFSKSFPLGAGLETFGELVFDDQLEHTVKVYCDGFRRVDVWLEEPSTDDGNIDMILTVRHTTSEIAPSYEIGGEVNATGGYSLAEGYGTTASGNYSHSEGYGTLANDLYSHAEGYNTQALGNGVGSAHAEGTNTTAYDGAHAEGVGTKAYLQSHAEGCDTVASGQYSHAEGHGTDANRAFQTVMGEYNVLDTGGTATGTSAYRERGDYAFIIGNGTGDAARSNAFTVDWNGNVNIPSGANYKINGVGLSASSLGAVPTSRTVNGKPLTANVSDTDYVVTQGADSGWYYRKWKSGRAEAWGIASFASRTGTAWGSFWYSDIDVSIPTSVFSSELPLRAYATSTNLQWMALGVTIQSSIGCRIRMVKPVSSSQAGGIYLYLFSA